MLRIGNMKDFIDKLEDFWENVVFNGRPIKDFCIFFIVVFSCFLPFGLVIKVIL